MKDNKSLLLGLLSIGLVVTWVYHLVDKSSYSKRSGEIYIRDSVAVAEAVSDSLRKYYSKTLNELSSEKMLIDSANTDLQGELGEKIREINKLRNEIGEILKRKNLTQEDLAEANEKINELQGRIDNLKSQNSQLDNERNRLNDVLVQLNSQVNSLQQNMQKVNAENKVMAKKINDASIFIASEISFAAYNQRSNEKEIETNQQRRADKFIASFTLQNNVADFPNAEIIIVITDPEGKTVNNEIWDVGSFETRNEGRKIYTRKMKFEYTKGEKKKLLFTLEPANFEKGSYRFSLYHKGVRIGGSAWKLS